MSLFEELASFCLKDFSQEAERKCEKKKPIPKGPWGADHEEGDLWSFNVEGDAIIKKIVVYSGAVIDCISFEYEFEGDDYKVKFGGDGGSFSGEFSLNSPEEYLTGISGTSRQLEWSRQTAISSVKFVSNLKEYGPFGLEEGSHFKLPLEGVMILGFYGRVTAHLNSIGVYLKAA